MNFYYNFEINVCAEEKWVVEYLIENEYFESEEEALEALHTRRNCEGWVDCEVSNTIEELVNEHYGVV